MTRARETLPAAPAGTARSTVEWRSMNPLIEQHAAALREICKRFRVRRLDAFGSVVGEAFDPQRSDIDFLVEFEPGIPAERYDRYFGLLEALQRLFGRPVDLVEPQTIRNPYVLRSVERERRNVYAA